MACPSLEEHFEKLGRKIEGIDSLHVDGRYSFMDRYAVDLRVGAIKDSVLAALDEEVDDDLTMLRDFLYKPNSLNFIKAINLLKLMGNDKRELALGYALGYLEDFWGVEDDEYRILPRNYVEAIVQADEGGFHCPEWIWKLCKSIDISYLSPEDKVKFLHNMVNSPFLEDRTVGITSFNVGLFDYSERNGWDRGYIEVARAYGVIRERDERDNLNLNTDSLMSLRRFLESMPNLVDLSLSGVILPEGNSIAQLVNACPNKKELKSLDVSYTNLEAYQLVEFEDLELDSLEVFKARGHYTFDYSRSHHEFLKNLKVLDLAGVTINRGGVFLDEIQCYENLEELNLSDCHFGHIALFQLKSDSLKRLDITRLRCSHYNGFNLDLSELEDLRAKDCIIWNAPGLVTVSVPRLKHLAFSGISGGEVGTPVPILNDGFVKVLSSLVSVDFDGCNFPPAVMNQYLDKLGDGLKYLNLPELDEVGITQFSEQVSGLQLEAFGYGGDPNELFDGEGQFLVPKAGLRELDLRGTMDQREYVVFDQSFTGSLEYLGLSYDSLVSTMLPLDGENLRGLKVLVSGSLYPYFSEGSCDLIYTHMTGNNFPPREGFCENLPGSSLMAIRIDSDLVPERLGFYNSFIAPHLQYGNVGCYNDHRRIVK